MTVLSIIAEDSFIEDIEDTLNAALYDVAALKGTAVDLLLVINEGDSYHQVRDTMNSLLADVRTLKANGGGVAPPPGTKKFWSDPFWSNPFWSDAR